MHVDQLFNPVIQDRTAVGVKGIDNSGDIIEHLKMHPHYRGVIHRNEHGVMWCTQKWNDVVNYCRSTGRVAMSFDFGYFDHYKHYMVDYYQENCVSSIYKQWPTISDLPPNWDTCLPSIRQYRDKILEGFNQARNDKPIKFLKGQKYIVIWAQWTTDLIRHCFYEDNRPTPQAKWLQRLVADIQQAGYVPVVKLSPVESTAAFQDIQHHALCFLGRKKHLVKLPAAKFVRNANARLIVNAERHIICCSSVSNELVLANAKVTAMGRSWFDNLGVFHEPKTWEDVINYQQPDPKCVNKWVNWWLSRQCLKQDVHEKIAEVFDLAQRS